MHQIFKRTFIFSVIFWGLMVANTLRSEPLIVVDNEVSANEVVKFKGIPWGMDFVDDSTLIVTLKQGEAWLWDTHTGVKKKVLGLPEIALFGQGGLLDVAVYPERYQSSDASVYKWLYFTYVVQSDGKASTALGRAKLMLNTKGSETVNLLTWQTLLTTKAFSSKGQHFGSRIAFDDTGHVFFGIGDRGLRKNAQNLSNHAGTIIRLNLDGSVPMDNPFVGVKNSLPEIWSYGHRNPQGLMFDSASGLLLSSEHGPRGGDEINLIKKGANYGWPIVSFGKEYWGPLAVGEGTEKEGMEAPLHVYVPSIAPSFLVQFKKDILFLGALAKQHLNSVLITQDSAVKSVKETRMLLSLKERVRSMAIRSDGEAFIGTDSGKIYNIVFKK